MGDWTWEDPAGFTRRTPTREDIERVARAVAETTKAAPPGPSCEGRAGPLRVLGPLALSVEDEVASHVRLPGGEPDPVCCCKA